jgi:hypothetical protein
MPVPVKSSRNRADARTIKVLIGDTVPLMAGTPFVEV